ncbi:MAG: hypothetical protein AMS26_06105 [Bacteroides sp. SM23_62]|nr:MAG: hypothetical protein AMS26_06105 [Bacteroides sp. SM23_62]
MNTEQLLGLFKGMGTGMLIVWIAIMVFMIVSWWIVFKKAGQPGWAILIPIYNFLVILRVAGKPWWWVFAILLPIIPFVGPFLLLVAMIFIFHGISKNFGQGAGFTVGLVLLSVVFVPILAFGDYKWQG